MRVRITFSKTDAMRFTGHLDLHRTWERTVRRAGLPLAYSQGFAPHPRINLASALPLGFTSDCELVDIWLEHDLPVADIQIDLERAAPPGMHILGCVQVDDRLPSLQSVMEASDFSITFLDPIHDLEPRYRELMDANELPRSWRGKPYDLRPLILDAFLLSVDNQSRPRLSIRLSSREAASGRPEEVVAALGLDPNSVRVHRERLIYSGQSDPAAYS
jgi:radical SAM-linked protein